MKTLSLLLSFFAGLCAALSVQAQEVLSPSTHDLLSKLDRVVENKHIYRRAYEKRLEQKKYDCQKLEGKEKQHALHQIFKAYARYQTDSAMVYLENMAQTPPFDEALTDLQRMGQAEVYAVTGNYADAELQLKQVHTQQLGEPARLEYYHLSRTLYGWMTNFSVQPQSKKELTQLTNLYRDSILMHEPPGTNRDIVRADSANVNHLPDLALSLSIADTANAQEHELLFIHYNMARSYGLKGNRDLQMYYLTLTAIADIQHGKTEYEALPRLAELCYEENQIDRAYRYLVCSMEDASFCKARLRTVEVSKIFPIIDHAYKNQEYERKRMARILIYGLCALALLLVIVVFYLRQQMVRLSATRKELKQANSQLQNSNKNLLATDKVKEEYIARYLDRCRSYIDTLELFRRSLLKRFKAHQMDELYKDLKSEETIHREQERFFEEFDNTFLNIYPSFVKDFNALLQPDAQIYPKGRELLNTEMRIFALIRLGVTDSQRIAHFLNYSIATIYSYRSKIRNKALGDKSLFEQEVMNIGAKFE